MWQTGQLETLVLRTTAGPARRFNCLFQLLCLTPFDVLYPATWCSCALQNRPHRSSYGPFVPCSTTGSRRTPANVHRRVLPTSLWWVKRPGRGCDTHYPETVPYGPLHNACNKPFIQRSRTTAVIHIVSAPLNWLYPQQDPYSWSTVECKPFSDLVCTVPNLI